MIALLGGSERQEAKPGGGRRSEKSRLGSLASFGPLHLLSAAGSIFTAVFPRPRCSASRRTQKQTWIKPYKSVSPNKALLFLFVFFDNVIIMARCCHRENAYLRRVSKRRPGIALSLQRLT